MESKGFEIRSGQTLAPLYAVIRAGSETGDIFGFVYGDGSARVKWASGDVTHTFPKKNAEQESFCGYPTEARLVIALRPLAQTLCSSGTCEGEPELLDIMFASADIARKILDTHWKTVLDLAQHLLDVKKMSGKKLTAFLNERMVRNGHGL